MIPTGWKVALVDDLIADGRRLIIYRHVGPGHVDVITGYTPDSIPIVDRHDPAQVLDFRGFLMPYDALDALAEALKPGPTAGELARLTDALDVERDRVDRVLDATVDAVRLATPPPQEDTPR